VPPSLLATLPDAALPALATLVVAGERCTPEVLARWSRGRRLLNAYGPTEATVCATIGQPRLGDGPPPIGRPIANTEVYVLDDALERAPIGIAAELFLGGEGVAIGYLKRPELTAERFVPHPFSAERGRRLYRTGDVGRWRRDGALELHGRVDT